MLTLSCLFGRCEPAARSGAWRSLVAHLVWDQGVAGSNPVAPTIFEGIPDGIPFSYLLFQADKSLQNGRPFGVNRLSHPENKAVLQNLQDSSPRTPGVRLSFAGKV